MGQEWPASPSSRRDQAGDFETVGESRSSDEVRNKSAGGTPRTLAITYPSPEGQVLYVGTQVKGRSSDYTVGNTGNPHLPQTEEENRIYGER